VPCLAKKEKENKKKERRENSALPAQVFVSASPGIGDNKHLFVFPIKCVSSQPSRQKKKKKIKRKKEGKTHRIF